MSDDPSHETNRALSSWDSLWEVFHRVRDVELSERTALLNELCGPDVRLHTEVEELLQADLVSSSPLDRSPVVVADREERIEAPPIQPGMLLCGRFEIIRLVGQGGMGSVYEALDRSLGGRVALKTLLPAAATNERARKRFYREIDLARQVTHPNVCRLFDLFEHHDEESNSSFAFVTMELLGGETLAQRLRRAKLTTGEALEVARQVAAALDAAHACGIVHRDLKPTNVILTLDNGRSRVVVTDFGLALRTGQESAGGERVTRSGELFGTPAYMAPEQLLDEEISPATDVYAFGTILYEMVTGMVPFAADSPISAAMKRLRDPAPSPRQIEPSIDDAWAEAIARCLQRHPSDRYQSASEVFAALSGSRLSRRQAWSRPFRFRRKQAALVLVLAAGLVAALLFVVPALRRQDVEIRASGTDSINFRRLWIGNELLGLAGSVSRDGRLMSYVDWSTGDLAIRDLSTGKSRLLTNKGPWSQSRDYAEQSAISPDGRRVAYGWGTGDGFELRVIGTDLSRPQLLYRQRGSYVAPFDWSPDGRSILVVIGHPELVRQIAMISAVNGTVKILKSWNGRSVPRSIGISPDGRFVAYDLVSEGSEGTRDLFVVSVADRTERPLVEHPGDDRFLEWSPDGRSLLFLSSRGGKGEPGLWSVPVEQAKAADEPRLIRERMGLIVPLGFTRENGFFYGTSSSRSDVFTGRLAGSPLTLDNEGRIEPQAQGQTEAPVFSHDGKSLAFVRENEIEIRTERQEPRRLPSGMRDHHLPRYSVPRWSPDDRSLVMTGIDLGGVHGFHRLDLHSGSVELLLKSDYGEQLEQPLFSPDGQTLYYISHGAWDARPWTILGRDLTSGTTREIYRAPVDEFRRIDLSPDGRRIALVRQRNGAFQLEIVPVQGGPVREILRFQEAPPKVPHVAAWMPDGASILLSRNERELWQVDATTGSPTRVASIRGTIQHVSIDSVRHRLAWSAAETINEVWVLENLAGEIERHSAP